MTPTVKTATQFVYPVYLWILVIEFINDDEMRQALLLLTD